MSAPDLAPPPVPDGPVLCDTFEMAVVHAAFRSGYGDAAGLVRSVAAGDTGRAEFVGQVLADLDASLHAHHHSEDLELWDRLEQRAPSCALHVGLMRVQHAQVADHLATIDPLRAQWRRTADPAVGEELAAAYDALFETLSVHLRQEVAEVVPVAARVLTQDEWALMGKHSQGAIPTSRLLVQLGTLLAAQEPELRARFFGEALPPPIRLLYRLVGRRQFEKQHRALFPDRPVPATLP